MKKIISLFFAICFILACSSCNFLADTASEAPSNDLPQSSDTSDNSSTGESFYVQSIPQDIEYNGVHYQMVQGVGVKTSVNHNEVGDLLGYIIRSEDIQDFIEEYPNTDYIICEGVYNYYNNNRVPFYKVKGYDDLRYICVDSIGEYRLYRALN